MRASPHSQPAVAGALERELVGALRKEQYSLKTEQSYVGWYRRFVIWNGKRHPNDLGAREVSAFLTHLAVDREVSAATQNQALNAIVFLYKRVLRKELAGIAAERAKQTHRLPTVLTTLEVAALLRGVSAEPAGLAIRLLYGCGLRVNEALALRVQDVDLAGEKLEVRAGKGNKDRVVSLPKTLLPALRNHQTRIRLWHEADRRAGAPGVALPRAFAVKSPQAAQSWPWFWFFPAKGRTVDPRSGIARRHHLHEIGVTRELGRAAKLARLPRRVTAHVLRHSFATHLVLKGVDIRSVQDLLGHVDLRTTQVYVALARSMRGEIASPLDDLADGAAVDGGVPSCALGTNAVDERDSLTGRPDRLPQTVVFTLVTRRQPRHPPWPMATAAECS